MAKNIEIKASLDDMQGCQDIAKSLSDSGPVLIHQCDTFFHCSHGRLKLREFGDGTGELIAYSRPDQSGPKTSNYTISRTSEPDSLCLALENSLGIRAVVTKQRLLYLAGRTRIHLDQVEGLGDFLELEVVLNDGEDGQAGVEEAHDLMEQLKVPKESLIQDAYVDLLERTQQDESK